MSAAACAVAASNQDQITDAQAMIDRAEKLSSLTQPDSSPFYFEARIDTTPSRMRGKGGIYKLWWATKDKWREEAEAADVRGTQVRNAQGLWTAQDPDPKIEAIFAGGGRWFPFLGRLVAWNEKVLGLRERKIDGAKLPCVQLERTDSQRELCFDPQSGLLLRLIDVTKPKRVSQSYRLEPIESVIEYRDYTGVGDKLLPSEIRRLRSGQVISVLRLVKVALDPKTQFAASMFEAPAGYQVWPACERYESVGFVNGLLEPPIRFSGQVVAQHFADGIRVIVGPDGKAQDVQLIHPVGRPSREVIDAFMNQKYRPATCDGKPVIGVISAELPR